MTPSNTPTLPPLPKSWPTHTKAALVHVHALARIVFGLALGDAAQNLGATVTCPNCERLHSEVALSEEHLALIHSRFSRTPQRKRSRFSPPERLRALTLMASRGWSRAQAANALLVEPPTVSRWLAWARDDSPRLEIPEPVNKFPDVVTGVVQRLKASFPTFGKRRIAQVLARLGLHLSVSTVARKLKAHPVALLEPPLPPVQEPTATSTQGALNDADDDAKCDSAPISRPQPRKNTLAAKYPAHIWGLDITAVPTFLGFWVPWIPFTIAPSWPFCWHVVGVLDFFSRKIIQTAVFRKNPSAEDISLVLDHAVARAGGEAPKHIVSDKGSQFWSHETESASAEFEDWCTRHGVKPRFGAIGKTASIARVERFWRTLKTEWTRRILVPFGIDAMHTDLDRFVRWYNVWRPHQGIAGATPEELYREQAPARDHLRIEVREHYPLPDARASPADVRRGTLRGLRVTHLDAHGRLPCVELDFDLAA